MASKLVWSTSVGYPADWNYREYYRDIGFDLDQKYLEPFQYAPGVRTHTGIKYHRITGKTQDKHLYNPDWARETAEKHARDFAQRCRDLAGRSRGGMPFPCAIAAPYDAELFGHWWFEGPIWLERVLELAAPGAAVEATTPARELDAGPSLRRAFFAEGSWGAGGDHRVWVNDETAWFWRELMATSTHGP